MSEGQIEESKVMTDEEIWIYAMNTSIKTYSNATCMQMAEDLASESYEVFCRRTNGTSKRNHKGYALRSIPLILMERVRRKIEIDEQFKAACEHIEEALFGRGTVKHSSFEEEDGEVNVRKPRASLEHTDPEIRAKLARSRLFKLSRRLAGKGKRAKKVAEIIQFAIKNKVVNFADLAKHFGVSRQAISSGFSYARGFYDEIK
jgi:hypothetical protein